MYFYTFKQYLYNKQSEYNTADVGNNWKVSSRSNVTLNLEREISIKPILIWCSEGLYFQTLPFVVSDGPTSYLLILVFSLLWVSQKYLP